MRIELDFNSPEAIYIQLRNQIVMQIAQEQLRDGDSLPSVRFMVVFEGVLLNRRSIFIPLTYMFQ